MDLRSACGDNVFMPCPIEEKLKAEMLAADRKDILALGMSASRARALGEKRRFQERDDAKRNLQIAESKYNSHIATCPTCKSEGLREWHNSELKE
jgi:hypothetical protein